MIERKKKETDANGLGTAGRQSQCTAPEEMPSPNRHIAPHVAAIATYAQHSRSARDAQSLALLYRESGILADQQLRPRLLKNTMMFVTVQSSTLMLPGPPVGPTCALLPWLRTNEPGSRCLPVPSPQASPNGRTETEILWSELVHRSPTGVR